MHTAALLRRRKELLFLAGHEQAPSERVREELLVATVVHETHERFPHLDQVSVPIDQRMADAFADLTHRQLVDLYRHPKFRLRTYQRSEPAVVSGAETSAVEDRPGPMSRRSKTRPL
jgi:hypothetical protein